MLLCRDILLIDLCTALTKDLRCWLTGVQGSKSFSQANVTEVYVCIFPIEDWTNIMQLSSLSFVSMKLSGCYGK